MNIVNKLTLKNLKKNKKRTIVTIIGVILSTALICAVAGMAMSFKQTMTDYIKTSQGDFHIGYENVPTSELNYIEKNVGVESYFYSKNLGYSKLEKTKNEYKPYLNVVAMTDDAMGKTGIQLSEGKMPENENEILIPESLENNAGVKHKIGDIISLEVGKRVDADGVELTQSDDYDDVKIDGNNPYDNEKIIDTTSKKYKIVGIMKGVSGLIENYSAPGYTIITKLNDKELGKANEKYNIYVKFKEAKKSSTINENILKTIEKDTKLIIKTTKNITLLEYDGDISANQLTRLYYMAAIIIGIIVATSVFVIKNSFSISVTEKTKEFGMLSSIGTTSRQIRKSVMFEGLIIALVGIPLGIILGIGAIFVLVQVLNLILAKEFLEIGMKFVYAIPAEVIVFSAIFGAITIFLSCIIPAIKASKISPIEAIRLNNDIKIKNKKLKTSRLTKKLFGIGGVIASKNLKRSKKKYRTTVVSLVVSIFIFISLSAFIQYGVDVSKLMYAEIDYNIEVTGLSQINEGEINGIIKNSLVNEYSFYRISSIEYEKEKYSSDYIKEKYANSTAYDDNGEKVTTTNTMVIFVNREYFKEFAKKIGINEKDIDKSAILVDDILEYNDDQSKTVEHTLNVKEGDVMTGKETPSEKVNNDEIIDITITKRTDKKLRGWEYSYAENGMIFVSEDYYQKDKFKSFDAASLYIKSDKPGELESQLTDMKKNNENYSELYVRNMDTDMKQMDRMILIISIFLYGFIIVITLIGVTNIFNTITTNMILRRKEFAMLKSVGMTTKEFNKMIRLESIMYGMKSLVIGIPLGILGSYEIYKQAGGIIDLGYKIPFIAVAISVVFVFAIVGITMKYSMKQINKQNIVETIRNDNI